MFFFFFFFSSRRRHTRLQGDWSSDVCSSDLREAHAARLGGDPIATPSQARGDDCPEEAQPRRVLEASQDELAEDAEPAMLPELARVGVTHCDRRFPGPRIGILFGVDRAEMSEAVAE